MTENSARSKWKKDAPTYLVIEESSLSKEKPQAVFRTNDFDEAVTTANKLRKAGKECFVFSGLAI